MDRRMNEPINDARVSAMFARALVLLLLLWGPASAHEGVSGSMTAGPDSPSADHGRPGGIHPGALATIGAGQWALDGLLGAAAAEANRHPDRWHDIGELLAKEPLGSFGVGISIGEALSAAIALLVTLLLSSILQRGLKRYGSRRADVNEAALYTVSRLVHYVLLAFGVLLALRLAGIPLSQFAVFTGAIGVGLGFGLQAIFSNFLSGLILLFDRSLKVGDFVELDDDMRGVVRAINIRSTLITTNDNIDVLVPNSEFVSKRLVNWTHGSVHRRIRIAFSAGYDVDKELVKKAALEAAAQVPFTLSMDGRKRPQVWLTEFGDNAVGYILAVWLTEDAARRNTSIRAAYMWELDTAFKKYGVDIPFPQQDLNIRSLFGLRGADAIGALRGEARAEESAARGPALDPHERDLLSRNDAKEETRLEIEEAEQRGAEAAQVAAGSPPA
jgi:small-conductance mechanosensitive channel